MLWRQSPFILSKRGPMHEHRASRLQGFTAIAVFSRSKISAAYFTVIVPHAAPASP